MSLSKLYIDIEAEIQKELDSLDGVLKTQKGKRNKTIRAIAHAKANDLPIAPLFGKDGVISETNYYRKNKDWYHNQDFTRVLENVIRLYIRRIRETNAREDADEAKRRKQQRAALITASKAQLLPTIQNMKTKEANPTQVATFLKTVLEQERQEFNEEPVKKTAVEVSGPEGGPVSLKAEEVADCRQNLLEKLNTLAASFIERNNIPELEDDTETDPDEDPDTEADDQPDNDRTD